tara:strand:- start:2210 stop:4993 length:2784 start_codon:yes stop_codon:yes gene_type:complete
MATVQLKDLMDPLVKIQTSTEETSNKIDKLLQVVVGAATVSDSLNQAILTELQLQTQLLQNIASGSRGGGISSLFGRGRKSSGLGESGNSFKLLGAGTMEMAKALILFAFVPKKALNSFHRFIMDLFKTLDEYDQKQIKEGSKNLMLMGDAILNFSKSLALSALLILPGMLAIPFLAVSIATMSGIMWLIGLQAKNISAGAKALEQTGKGIKAFAIGLAFFAAATLFLLLLPNTTEVLMGMAASLLFIGTAVGALGLISGSVTKGANALESVGDGIKSFAIGLAFFAATTFFLLLLPNTTQVLMTMAASLLLVGGAVAILGTVSKSIKKGSSVLRSLGLGLGLFSLGYAVFAFMVSKITEDDIKIQLAIVGGLGLIAMILGKRSKDVMKGSLALALLGVGLAAFSFGYSFFNKEVSGMTFTDVGVQLLLLGGIVGIVGIVSMIGVGTFIKGSIALALLGPALWVFGWGYSNFADATKGLSFTDVGVQLLVLGGITVVAGIAGALMMAGGIPALGALAIALIGPALWAFSWGYSQFADATKGLTFENVGNQLLLLGGIVTVTSLAGIALPLVLLGSISLGLIGLGIFGLTFGLKKYKEIGWTPDDTSGLTGTISSLLTAFGAVPPGGAGGSGGDAGFFGFLGDMGKTVGNIIQGGLGAMAVIANALSIIVIGASVATLSLGLKPYKELGWEDKDTNTLTHLMKSLMGVFGGEGSGGVIGALGGLIKSGINAATATVNTGVFFVVSKVIPTLAKGLAAYNKIGWTMDKTKVLIGSMLGISQAVSGFDNVTDNAAAKFMTTMTTLNNNTDGLMNAADGVQSIADAINSVDVTKADSMSNFFGAATEYSKTAESSALDSLIDTVAEIRDGINSLGQSATTTSAASTTENSNNTLSLSESLSSLQTTLNQINVTMTNLPADIAQIEIKIPQD